MEVSSPRRNLPSVIVVSSVPWSLLLIIRWNFYIGGKTNF